MITLLSNSLLRDPDLILLQLEARTGAGTSAEWLKRGSGRASFVLDVFSMGGSSLIEVAIEHGDGATWTTAGSFTPCAVAGHELIDVAIDGFVRCTYRIAGDGAASFQVIGELS